MAFLTKPGILALLRTRLRLNDVTLSLMSSLLVVLRDLSAWFSIFDTAHLTDLGSKSKRKAMNWNWYNQKANPALNTKAGNK